MGTADAPIDLRQQRDDENLDAHDTSGVMASTLVGLASSEPTAIPFPIVVSVLSRSLQSLVNAEQIRRSVHDLLLSLVKKWDSALHVMLGCGGEADTLVAEIALKLRIPLVQLDIPGQSEPAQGQPGVRHRVGLGATPPCQNDPVGLACWERRVDLLMRSGHVLLSLESEGPIDWGCSLADRWWRPDDFPFKPSVLPHGARRSAPLLDRLDVEVPVPWLQITSETVTTGTGTSRSALRMHLPGHAPVSVYVPGLENAVAAMPAETQSALDRIVRLNQHVMHFNAVDRCNFRDQFKSIGVDAVPDAATAASEPLRQLRLLQAGVDIAARSFQRWLFGVGVPALDVHDWYRQAKGNRARGGWMPSINTLLVFCALVPLIVGLFELYAHPPYFMHMKENRRFFLYGYLVLFLFGYLFYRFVVRRWSWQDQFQDYRVMAEALRVQLFWSLSRLPEPVADHYLLKHRAELGWVRYALRAVLPWSQAVCNALPEPCRSLVISGWVQDQSRYYRSAARRNHASERRSRRRVFGLLFIGFGAAAITAFLAGAHSGDWGLGIQTVWNGLLECLPLSEHGRTDLHYLAIIIIGIMPPMAAFFGLSREIRAFEGHAQGYELMHNIFERAADAEVATRGDDTAFQDLVFTLGKEAINENAEWLMDHRHRPIEHHVG